MAAFRPRQPKKVTSAAGDAPVPAGSFEARPQRFAAPRGQRPTYLRVPVALKFAVFIAILVVAFMTWQTYTATAAAGARLEGEINKSGVTLVTALAAMVDPGTVDDASRQAELVAELRRFSSSRGAEQVLNTVVYDSRGQAIATARGESRFIITVGDPVEHEGAAGAGVEIKEFSYEGVPVRSFSRRILKGSREPPPGEGSPSAAEVEPRGRIEIYVSAEEIEVSRRELSEAMRKVSVAACLVAAAGAYLLSRFLTRPIRTLVKDMRQVSQGNLAHQSKVDSSDEIGDLARAFNTMTSNLQAAQEAKIAQKAIEHELSLATQIQTRLLPSAVPRVAGFDISSYYVSAKEVGGDYYDFIQIDPDRLGIVVADVSGKGVPGSLVMTMTRSLLRAAAEGEPSPSRTVDTVNRLLSPDMSPGMFVTLAYVVLELESREARLVRCGHNAPLLHAARPRPGAHPEGGIITLQPRGIALGLDRAGPLFRSELQVQRFALRPGDALVLYTDGVVEAKDRDGADYSDARLRKVFADHARGSAREIVEAILGDLSAHRRGAEQSDDITLIAIKSL